MKKIFYTILILQALFFSTNAFSQTAIYLKAQAPGYNFNGGVTASGYENQIELFSFSDGIVGCITSTGGNKSCASTFSGLNFITKATTAVIDFKSVQLQGKTITSADMFWVTTNTDGSRSVSYKIRMEDIRVVSVQESGSGGGDPSPTVSVSLQPSRIAWKAITQNPNGTPGPSSSYGWDFANNIPFTPASPF